MGRRKKKDEVVASLMGSGFVLQGRTRRDHIRVYLIVNSYKIASFAIPLPETENIDEKAVFRELKKVAEIIEADKVGQTATKFFENAISIRDTLTIHGRKDLVSKKVEVNDVEIKVGRKVVAVRVGEIHLDWVKAFDAVIVTPKGDVRRVGIALLPRGVVATVDYELWGDYYERKTIIRSFRPFSTIEEVMAVAADVDVEELNKAIAEEIDNSRVCFETAIRKLKLRGPEIVALIKARVAVVENRSIVAGREFLAKAEPHTIALLVRERCIDLDRVENRRYAVVKELLFALNTPIEEVAELTLKVVAPEENREKLFGLIVARALKTRDPNELEKLVDVINALWDAKLRPDLTPVVEVMPANLVYVALYTRPALAEMVAKKAGAKTLARAVIVAEELGQKELFLKRIGTAAFFAVEALETYRRNEQRQWW